MDIPGIAASAMWHGLTVVGTGGGPSSCTFSADRSAGITRFTNQVKLVIATVGAMALSDSPHLVGRTTVVLADNLVAPRVRQALRVRLGDRVEWGG